MAELDGNTLQGYFSGNTPSTGIVGFKGETGASAYEIAVKHGFSGTEAQWIESFGIEPSDYVAKVDIVDNLTTQATDKPLSAKQGYLLKSATDTLTGAKVNISDIEDSLTSTSAVKVLSAKQGKLLKDAIDTTDANIGDLTNLTTTDKDSIVDAINELDSGKQATLTSGTNIKTISGSSILGSGNLALDNIIFRDIADISVTATAETAVYSDFTVPTVSGYTCIGVSLKYVSGGGSGYIAVTPTIAGSLAVVNNTSTTRDVTIGIRCIYLKN